MDVNRPDDEQNEHKVTCGVKKANLQTVLDHLKKEFDGSNVQANIISSGIGDWRSIFSLVDSCFRDLGFWILFQRMLESLKL